jgi:predicted dithiol-disulfide oxidoreductase (DUF899 family)
VEVSHRVVSAEESFQTHQEHLAKEKNLTRQWDELSRQRRELPWVKVDKHYVFEGPKGKETLTSLFDGRSQLIVYHFMFGPGWDEGCPSCSMVADHINASFVHLLQRDVTPVVISRATLPEIERFRKRMGWDFHWVSSNGNDFNRDYHVSFTKEERAKSNKYYNFETAEFPSEEGPGLSVFYRDGDGAIFHTFSTYGRGLEWLLGAYNYLDLAPNGRDEESLPYPMAWVRHHDRYDNKLNGSDPCCSPEESHG